MKQNDLKILKQEISNEENIELFFELSPGERFKISNYYKEGSDIIFH